jgi:hypothetical protein
VGIHRLLQPSICFLNINTAITRQLIRIARTVEAEWWQVCGEAWVRRQRKMSQVLGAFGLLNFTMLRPVVAWRAFLNIWTVYFFNFTRFFGLRPTTDNESADTAVHLYVVTIENRRPGQAKPNHLRSYRGKLNNVCVYRTFILVP